jgi:endoglucanase Acf2
MINRISRIAGEAAFVFAREPDTNGRSLVVQRDVRQVENEDPNFPSRRRVDVWHSWKG